MASTRTMRNQLSYVECRMFGHAWEQFTPRSNSAVMKGYGLTIRCTRCGTERYDSWDRKGDLDGRRYKHPDDYKIAREDTPDRPSLRLLFARVENMTYSRVARATPAASNGHHRPSGGGRSKPRNTPAKKTAKKRSRA